MTQALPDPDHDAALILTALIVPFTAFTALFFLPLLYLLVNASYRWVTLTRYSATPGMALTAIEFRRADGALFDGATAGLHTLGFLASSTMVVPQLISALLMVTSARGQGLSDLVLGTVAINRRSRF
jgi:hypothetical protein